MPCGFFAGIPFMQEGERNARWPIPHTMLHDRLTELVCHDGSRGALVAGERGFGRCGTEWNQEPQTLRVVISMGRISNETGRALCRNLPQTNGMRFAFSVFVPAKTEWVATLSVPCAHCISARKALIS